MNNPWNSELLQPKRQIGEFVAAAGFHVPERYDSFEEALAAVDRGETIMVRSEHPEEYDGPSGLMRTYAIDQTAIAGSYGDLAPLLNDGYDPAAVLSRVKELALAGPIGRYLEVTGKDPATFAAAASFSFWRHIPGRNVTIAADDWGRYHLTSIDVSSYGERSLGGSGYIADGSGHSPEHYKYEWAGALTDTERAVVIRNYEAVRQLPGFPAGHPIMEWQLDPEGRPWFLQIHPSQPLRPKPERLAEADFPAAEGWQSTKVVRGALGSAVTLQAALWYPDGYGAPGSGLQLPETEPASFDLQGFDHGLSAALSPRRTAYISRHDFQGVYAGMSNGHELRSRWFGPRAALAIGRAGFSELIPQALQDKVSRSVHRQGQMARVVLDVASDGLQGFVRLNPDAEQPAFDH